MSSISTGYVAWLLVGDQHLGEGAFHPGGSPNRLEDFLDDDGHARLLEGWLRRHPEAGTLRLCLLGDVVNFDIIRHDGRWGVEPTEEAALAKLETCLYGHPVFWGAIRAFLKDARAEVIFILGNHDLEFAWSKLQERLRSELSPSAPDRISFEEKAQIGGILATHGDDFEPLNSKPPKVRRFVTHLGQRLLNVPPSSKFSVGLMARFKHLWPWLGYVAHHAPIWLSGAIRSWSWGRWVLSRLAVIRLRQYLTAHPGVHAIIAGHTHLACRFSLSLADGRKVTYLNCGAGIKQARLVWRRFWFRYVYYTEWTPVEIISAGPLTQAQRLRFDPDTATFSDWR